MPAADRGLVRDYVTHQWGRTVRLPTFSERRLRAGLPGALDRHIQGAARDRTDAGSALIVDHRI